MHMKDVLFCDFFLFSDFFRADQALSLAEKEAAALKILAELTRAEKETLANTEKIPVTNRNSLMNQPTGK